MNDNIIDMLKDLFQLDIDAAAAYDQALEKIDDDEVYENIKKFKNDHLRHVDDLSQMIKKLGGEVPERKQDLKGYLLEGVTYLRSVTGTKGALQALKTNEMVTNKSYKKALDDNSHVAEDIKQLLQNNYNDERRHLQYIETALNRFE